MKLSVSKVALYIGLSPVSRWQHKNTVYISVKTHFGIFLYPKQEFGGQFQKHFKRALNPSRTK